LKENNTRRREGYNENPEINDDKNSRSDVRVRNYILDEIYPSSSFKRGS